MVPLVGIFCHIWGSVDTNAQKDTKRQISRHDLNCFVFWTREMKALVCCMEKKSDCFSVRNRCFWVVDFLMLRLKMRSLQTKESSPGSGPDIESFRLRLAEQMAMQLSRSISMMSADFWYWDCFVLCFCLDWLCLISNNWFNIKKNSKKLTKDSKIKSR